MPNNNVLTLTDENFDREVLQSNLPVVVDIWADWCQPCKMLAPIIDELAQAYSGRVKIGKLDTDANPRTPTRLGVSAIPTVLIYKNGQIVKKFVGFNPKSEFIAELDKVA